MSVTGGRLDEDDDAGGAAAGLGLVLDIGTVVCMIREVSEGRQGAIEEEGVHSLGGCDWLNDNHIAL